MTRPVELFIVLAGAALAGFVQGLSGFGFSLTAMSIWAWALEPRLAAVLAVAGALTGQVFTAFRLRRSWDLPLLLPFLLGALPGLPIGLYILPQLDVPLFKAVLGALLAVFCPLMYFANRLPRITGAGRLGDALAGMGGGIMGGLGGSTGVIPTLWCTLRGLDKDQQRAVIQNFNLAALAVTFVAYLATGIATREMLPLLALVVPAMLIPSMLGARLYLGISDAGFRKVVLGLLTASGIGLLASAGPELLRRL